MAAAVDRSNARSRSRRIASRPKFYCLEMFAYPSGHAHVGHVRNYIIGDVMARMKRMRGFNVLHPFGWDAFGLPAENAAIKTGTHPETSTLDNIAHMKGQLQRLGISYAWEREIATCLPELLQVQPVDLPEDVRARPRLPQALDRQLVPELPDRARQRAGRRRRLLALRDDGRRRAISEQWFFRITAYADELLKGLDTLTEWPEKVVVMQRNWIGRSEGRAHQVSDRAAGGDRRSRVFTHAHRHDLRRDVRAPRARTSDGRSVRRGKSRSASVRALASRVSRARSRGAADRRDRKEGFDTGRKAHQSVHAARRCRSGSANFVLAEYGTGAIMAVPAHDRARLRVRAQIQPADPHRGRAGG